LQLRSPNKTNWPNYWDISAAGHLNVGETTLDAAVRETLEEINLPIDRKKLYYIFSDHWFDKLYEEIRHVFLYQIDEEKEFNFNDGEVADLRWFSIDKLKEWVKNPEANSDKIVPEADWYYPQLFWHLERLVARENS